MRLLSEAGLEIVVREVKLLAANIKKQKSLTLTFLNKNPFPAVFEWKNEREPANNIAVTFFWKDKTNLFYFYIESAAQVQRQQAILENS